MLIQEACRAAGLTKKAVEYYVEQGLIAPPVLENGYRWFDEAEVSRLQKIAVLRGLGLDVSEIRTVLETGGPALPDVLRKKELELADRQAKQVLIKQLADGGDWAAVKTRLDALQKKQSILNRILDKFPGSYGKLLCLHFAPYLDEPVKTQEQQEAFETIIRFWDGMTLALPDDLRKYLDEAFRDQPDAAMQKASDAIAEAARNPERYLRDNQALLDQYQAVIQSEAYKATPAYRLKECLKQIQSESGYTDVFIPAMRRLSPSYRAYHEALQKANEIFLKHYPSP